MERSWTPILRSLADHFQSHERQLNLIRAIDQRVINDQLDVDDLVRLACDELRTITGASGSAFYLLTGTESEEFFLLQACSGNDFPHILRGNDASPLRAQFRKVKPKAAVLSATRFGCLISNGDDRLNSSVMALPLSVGNEPFAVLLLLSPLPPEHSRLSMPEVREYSAMVAAQLEIVLAIILERRFSRLTNEFIKTALDENLRPSACLGHLVKNVAAFVPDFGPLRIEPKPKAQILYYRPGDSFLTIMVSEGDEPFNTRVLIEESICGLLIERLQRDPNGATYVVVDPHDYPNRYQWFLDATEARAPRSELAVAVLSRGEPIAVLNLEHPSKDVFLQQHVAGITQAAQALAPFLAALQERENRQKVKQTSLLAAVQSMLMRLAGQFQHRLATPLMSSRLELESLAEELADGVAEPTRARVSALAVAVDRIEESSDRFCQAIPEFLVYGSYNLRQLIGEVLDQFQPQKGHVPSSGVKASASSSLKAVSNGNGETLGDHLLWLG